jgi:hypothetical protein
MTPVEWEALRGVILLFCGFVMGYGFRSIGRGR